jgi:hypothetical protein
LLEARKGSNGRGRSRGKVRSQSQGNGKGGGNNCEGASTGDLAFTGFGGATVSGDRATLVSNDDEPFSGLDFALPGPVAFTDNVDNGNNEIVVDPNVAVDVEVGPPTSKDQCKNCGWATFNTPRAFKNQGDCIQFVNTGK